MILSQFKVATRGIFCVRKARFGLVQLLLDGLKDLFYVFIGKAIGVPVGKVSDQADIVEGAIHSLLCQSYEFFSFFRHGNLKYPTNMNEIFYNICRIFSKCLMVGQGFFTGRHHSQRKEWLRRRSDGRRKGEGSGEFDYRGVFSPERRGAGSF